jgi:penicillin-binding protein 1A
MGEWADGARSARRGCLGRAVRWSGLLLVACVGVGGAAGIAGAWWYAENVVRDPGPHLDREHILAVIAEESPVTYRDGTTRLGVFFHDEHRAYVGWHDLPPSYVASIVAAEDGAFWRHAGVSPKHITRALLDNLLAGRTVSGGSTLTQQTAKNLYYRPDRSWRSKIQELVNALRLEAHYEKSEILTFYANQFHVAGNGRGLGIAARYFFDKEASELTLVESAFLAGLVKAPSRYDPFIGDAERQQAARKRAHDRTRYVLQRVVDEPEANLVGPWPVSGVAADAADAERLRQIRAWKAEAAQLLDQGFELPFRRGQFRYDSNAILDEVRRRLAEPPFDEVLRKAGIDDPDRAGLVVVTTLDANVQREATYALWHHLTELGLRLEPRTAGDLVRADSPGPRFDPHYPPREHDFRLARVVEHPVVDGRSTLALDLGGHACTVDRDGVVRVALALERGATGNRNAKVPGAKVDALVKGLPVGSVVWVSVRAVGEGGALCDLELRPDLQGAAVVVEGGEIRAMVAGNDNQNFNRATARRQFGSTWKSVIFHAALQVGWSPDEPLDNRRNVFPFSTTFYHPRPDHTPEPVVSMSWAGVHSENLASVWLLYHLLDRLDGSQIAELARTLDLARRADEGEAEYRLRIQKAGVLPTRARLREGAFLKARQEVLPGIAASAHPEDALAVESLLYGWGHAAELERVAREPAASRERKTRALNNSFLHLEALLGPCRAEHAHLVDVVDRGAPLDPARLEHLWVRSDGPRVEVACGSVPTGYVRPDAAWLAELRGVSGSEEGSPAEGTETDPEPSDPAPRRGLGARIADLLGLGGAGPAEEPPPSRVAAFEDVLLDERMHAATFEALRASVERRQALLALEPDVDLYAPDHLYWHQDFRVLLALRYVAELARQYGIRSEVRPVLSLPLGASEITLEEATALYAGLVSGAAWDFRGEVSAAGALLGGEVVPAPVDPALLIAEVRDVDGRVLYRAKPASRPVADPHSGSLTADILRNVVVHGTGRRAVEAVHLGPVVVPVGGKTGTTNDYRNAAFVGFVPALTSTGWSVAEGATIGVYVGYDDNRPMSRGRIRIAGASGALPAWIGAADAVAKAGLLGPTPDAAPSAPLRFVIEDGLTYVAVDPTTGLPTGAPVAPLGAEDGAPVAESEAVVEEDGELAPIAEHAVLVAERRAPVAPEAVPSLEPVLFPERVAPSTEEAAERARERRRLIEELRRPRGLWDELE